MNITVKWTGEYPSLCCGKWIIFIDGIALTKIEQNQNFGTYIFYTSFDEEDDEEYSDGLDEKEWIEELKTNDINGLYASLKRHGIPISDELLSELYYKINKVDWRSATCGGCL